MGMYTELVCAFELEKNVPKQVIRTLYYMTGQEKEDILEQYGTPEHELFSSNRWRYMLQGDSYYFDGETHSNIKKDSLYPDNPMYYLTVRCNFKNYDNEIDKFIDWLKPYIAYDYTGQTRKFIGYQRYEENEEPTLLYV